MHWLWASHLLDAFLPTIPMMAVGIATTLMNKMIDEEEYSRIMLEVNEDNNPAIRLYNKLGFKEISLRERYYGEDTALIMEKVR